MTSKADHSKSLPKFSFAALPVEGADDESDTEYEDEPVKPASIAVNPPPKNSTVKNIESKKSQAKPPTTAPKVEGPLVIPASIPPLNGHSPPTPIEESAVASPRLPTVVTFDPKSFKSRSRSPGAPSGRFEPSLPELPSPWPSGMGARKRKASHELITNPLNKESKLEETPELSTVTGDFKYSDPPIDPGAEGAKKKQNAVTRTVWTLIMIFGFMGLLAMGHPWVIVLVFFCQALVYREVTTLFSMTHPRPAGGGDLHGYDAWDGTLNWYFFAVTNYFLYGESIIYYFKHVVFSEAQFLPFATNHRFISFMLYTIGFVGFVGSLKKQYLKHQFGLFAWVHMTLLVIVVSSHFIVNNILEGLIWFLVPASLVICNDIFAYICGITFGRTPLIKLSPKKTVEGFVGAFMCTFVFAVVWSTIFMQYPYMICPVHDLGTHAWSEVHCRPNSVFLWREFELWTPINMFFSSLFRLGHPIPPIPYAPFQLHALAMATFASLVAPFGGFFASGFKRAFDIKDFGDSIPGHGGMTDRMDCQFLMGMFSYVYYSALIREHHATVGSVLQTIVSSLAVDEQIELFLDLKRYLEGAGVSIPT